MGYLRASLRRLGLVQPHVRYTTDTAQVSHFILVVIRQLRRASIRNVLTGLRRTSGVRQLEYQVYITTQRSSSLSSHSTSDMTSTETNGSAKFGDIPTAILHRTPWRPPVASSANGIYITLEDGKTIIDAVGGAAVSCIGNGHPAVVKAIKDQVDKMACESLSSQCMCLKLRVHQMCTICSSQMCPRRNWLTISSSRATEHSSRSGSSREVRFHVVLLVRPAPEMGSPPPSPVGSEAMEGVIKTARQYFFETGQPQRRRFIGRQLSFHGNTVSTLGLAYHPLRRLPYAPLLDTDTFHHVSPAYAARFQTKDETEEQYVERLRKELDDKFQELGPDTVIGCECLSSTGSLRAF